MEAALKQNDHQHVEKWSESVGMGSKSFLETVKKNLEMGLSAGIFWRDKHSDSYQLNEDQPADGVYFQNDINT